MTMRTSTLGMYRAAIGSIADMQTRLSKTQQKIASGTKVLRNHEDPVMASRVKSLMTVEQQLKVYQRNSDTAENRLSLIETTLSNMINLTEDIYQLHKKSSNGTLTQNERDMIASELKSKLNEMIGLANYKDEKGEFLFSGFQGFQTPYTTNNGIISYHGDQGQRFIQVGSSTFIPFSESGESLFNQIRTGNGNFTTKIGPTPNAGTGIISNGSVVDFSSFIPDDYTITFVTNSSTELAYTITGATSGQVVPTPPDIIPDDAPTYRAGDNIVFNGHEISISGNPTVGDTFEVSPSGYQDIFTTVQNIVNSLESPINTEVDRAEFYSAMQSDGASLDRAIEHMLSQLTKIGARSSIVDNEAKITEELLIQNQQNLSSAQDIDYASALSEMSLSMTALQAAQASYINMAQMSLLNYL